ncbi:hypothetical protein [Actinomadura madurae]|uniref:hypothetical protein n=1 Tax=Actinomadura madurae TaxID=1993 RepID=UPI0020D20E3B|nr:hypothetical protein [Actinomadura madurae]MCQ0013037.1 hypothetical protein [Actinomadura madurae]
MERATIDVVGARTNNLRDVSVSIPKGRLVAFTGVSGSGKTSLAIDTLHNEAQLRYLEGLSPFVRQYITQRNRPKVDRILGLGATLAVDQRRLNRNPRSTVATITGIDGHLGLLFSRLPGIGAAPAAESGDGPLTTAHFDRDTPEGSCANCHGVGGRWQAQEDLIITHPELPLFGGASPWFARWRSGEHAFVRRSPRSGAWTSAGRGSRCLRSSATACCTARVGRRSRRPSTCRTRMRRP